MAVFGVPAAHEDDALRACRAAVEMRDAFPELGIEGRIGVNTGEVVAGTEERLATGDAVNVAARLEQAAEPGEVLIGEATLALVQEAVVAEAVEPLALKGKAEPVPAFRLLAVPGPPERSHASRFVGRAQELHGASAGVGPGADAVVLRAGDCRRRRGRGQVAPGRGGARRHRGPRRPRPLPSLRRGDHLLAGRRGRQAARRPALRRGGGGRGAIAARRERPSDERGRDRVGVPQAARGTGAARRLLRRPAVGRGDVPRSRRVDGDCCRRARRCCCCAWLGRSCSSGARPGRCRCGSSRSRPTRRTR